MSFLTQAISSQKVLPNSKVTERTLTIIKIILTMEFSYFKYFRYRLKKAWMWKKKIQPEAFAKYKNWDDGLFVPAT